MKDKHIPTDDQVDRLCLNDAVLTPEDDNPIGVGIIAYQRKSSKCSLPPTTCKSPNGCSEGWNGSNLKNALIIKVRADFESPIFHTAIVCTRAHTKNNMRRGVQ